MCAVGLGMAKNMAGKMAAKKLMGGGEGGGQATDAMGNVPETGFESGGGIMGEKPQVPKGEGKSLPEMLGAASKAAKQTPNYYQIPVGTAGSVPPVTGGQMHPIDPGYYQNPLNRQLRGY